MPLFAAPGLDHDWSIPLHEPVAQPKYERSRAPAQPTVITDRPISVLFVDERNKVRSVLAQALAEVTRLATLNQTGHNPFYRLDSAGLR
ncbi:MAG: hypothetical protein INR71_16445, partial [Terriglobus roseus]|nr:hypothetical protein [Terriglobus roseus]